MLRLAAKIGYEWFRKVNKIFTKYDKYTGIINFIEHGNAINTIVTIGDNDFL
jgi:hypothetical protein